MNAASTVSVISIDEPDRHICAMGPTAPSRSKHRMKYVMATGMDSRNVKFKEQPSQEEPRRFVYETRTMLTPSSPFRSAKVFHCQLAHGSPTGLISGLNSIKDVYHKIAECYDLSSEQILFCTLNTHKLDMKCLLGGQLGLDDFIFAHVKGQKKEVELTKDTESLGLTITDNGAGYAFIKRLKEGSTVDKLNSCVFIGDHIEKINDQSTVGWRHFDVAKHLKSLPVGTKIVLRLIEPVKAGLGNIAPRATGAAPRGTSQTNGATVATALMNGKQTIRFKRKGEAVVQDSPHSDIMDKINSILETYIGISDEELALRIWEIGQDHQNPVGFLNALKKAPDLAEFQLPEDVALDLWGAVSDDKRGRLTPSFQISL